jgi:putative SOS response-associated peptidase YedK
MDYLKVYCNLIRKAENRTPPEGYTEKHHTFPKSIFGKNNRVVVLTTREHYVAHLLLWKICKKRYKSKNQKTIKMFYALWYMNNRSKENRYCNSKLYEIMRNKFINVRKNDIQWKDNFLLGRQKMKNNPKYKEMMNIRNKELSKSPEWLDSIRKSANKRKENPVWIESQRKGKEKMKNNLDWQKEQKKRNDRQKKKYMIKFEDGKIQIITGLYEWCRNNTKYDSSAIRRVRTGKQHKHFDIIEVLLIND